MQTEKKEFVLHSPDGSTTVIDESINTIMTHVFGICSMDKDETIIKRLQSMFIASVRGREVFAPGELEDIIIIYESLSYFYEHIAKNVRAINYFCQEMP